MNTTPRPAVRTSSNLYPTFSYDDAHAAIAFLERAYGFQRRFIVPGENGGIRHSEVSLGDGVIMVSTSKPAEGRVSPKSGGAQSMGLCVYVADPDAHYARAKAAGAEITRELQDEHYGARGYMTRDPEGHVWYFSNYQPGEYWNLG